MKKHYPSWHQVQIRFRDLDPLAHVHNTVCFTYSEEARSYYFDQLDTCLYQAEDGMRHAHVTGVQTCALPILLRGGARGRSARDPPGGPVEPGTRVRRGLRSEERRAGKEGGSRGSAYQ